MDSHNYKKYKGLLESDIFDQTVKTVSEPSEKKQLGSVGGVTEKEILSAALKILLFLVITVWIAFGIYACKPEQGSQLLEICKITIPPLATLIIAFYWKDKNK